MREIALHILDICENSITAGATHIDISVAADENEDSLHITVSDDGCGMSEAMRKSAADPFTTTRTTRKVGMGLPLFKAGCENAGGSLKIESEPGRGTRVSAFYAIRHIDRPPLGEFAEAAHALVTANPNVDFLIKCVYNHTIFEMDTVKIRETLQGVPLNEPEVSVWILEYLRDNIRVVFGGKHI